jgi:polyisoprenyl-teichoic acid--peptidoglycan teichoic acid transferase
MSRHAAYRARSLPQSLGLTLLSALCPGSGFLMAGRVRLGAFVMTLTAALLGLGVYIGVARRDQVVALAVDPGDLLLVNGLLVFLGLCWIAILVASHRMLRPRAGSTGGRAFGALFVGLLCFAIAAPMAVGTQNVMAQRDLLSSVFASEGNSKSATRPSIDKKDPWAHKSRLNVLLLGADDGAGREGTRTDTVMVASIDTETGDTKLISLSRNWMRMPFPKDSPLYAKYPDGYWNPSLGNTEQPEYYLDSMYQNIPARYPGILGPSDNQGADVLKVSAGEALGLDIDYYMQVNLEGFRAIVDALGGITVNVNYRVPIGGSYGTGPGGGVAAKPHDYIEPGPNQKMMGARALWFARGRYGLSDPSRQERQRCTIKAIVDAADPGTLVTKYQAIAKAGKQLLRTDIPQELLPALVELGLKVKNATVSNVDLQKDKNFPSGRNPNYPAIRKLVATAISGKAPAAPVTPSSRPTTKATPGTQQNLEDACAYHPSQQ